jgi:hypothetical protein
MALSDRPYGPSGANPSGLSVITQNVQGEGPGPLPALQLISSATEAKILDPANTTLALSVAIPPNTANEQTVIDLYVSGYITTTASGTIALGLYADAGATVTSGNLLHKTASAVTQNSSSAPFSIHAKLQYDSVSGKLTGVAGGNINNVIDPEIALTNVITGIKNTNDPVVSFSLSITSSGALTSALTTINVQKFSVG